MLTPDFTLTQTEKAVVLHVRVPYARPSSNLQLSVNDCNITVACPPYFLKISLPHPVIDPDSEIDVDSTTNLTEPKESPYVHDIRNGIIRITLKKLNEGQHFPNLDLVSLLIAPSKQNINNNNSNSDPIWAPKGPSKAAISFVESYSNNEENKENIKSFITPIPAKTDYISNINDTDNIDMSIKINSLANNDNDNNNSNPEEDDLIFSSLSKWDNNNNSIEKETNIKETNDPIEKSKPLISIIDSKEDKNESMMVDNDNNNIPKDLTDENNTCNQQQQQQKSLLELETLLNGTSLERDSMKFNLNLNNENRNISNEEKNQIIESKLTNRYGFCYLYSNNSNHVEELLIDICDVTNLDSITDQERFVMLRVVEEMKFDDDHYIYDFMDKSDFEYILNYKPTFLELNQSKELNSEEQKSLIELPNSIQKKDYKNLILNEFGNDIDFYRNLKQRSLTSLIDILFAFCYNYRFTEGDLELNSESIWTISKISSVFSSVSMLPEKCGINQTLINCYRRCLIFPLYRNFELCKLIQNDLIKILSLGRREVIRRFIQLHNLFKNDECGHILDTLFIQDYLIYLQKNITDNILIKLSEKISNCNISKDDLDLNLIQLESLPFENEE